MKPLTLVLLLLCSFHVNAEWALEDDPNYMYFSLLEQLVADDPTIEDLLNEKLLYMDSNHALIQRYTQCSTGPEPCTFVKTYKKSLKKKSGRSIAGKRRR